jgi:hypothetical protein
VLNKLGLKGHLHTFRHAFISYALTRGVAEAIVRQWAGHVDADVIKVYTHIADAASQAALQRLTQAHDQPLQVGESQNAQEKSGQVSAQNQHNERSRRHGKGTT